MWRLRFGAPIEAWAAVPASHELERRRSWTRVVGDAVRSRWSADEVDRASQTLDDILEGLQRSRPELALADLVTWPTRSPLPLRVTFVIASDVAATDWEARGYESSPYLHGPFGEGVQHTRRTPSELDLDVESVDAVIVFDRGDVALVVRVHTCPLAMYVASASNIAALIETCELSDASGAPFTTGVHEHRELEASDAWPTAAGGPHD